MRSVSTSLQINSQVALRAIQQKIRAQIPRQIQRDRQTPSLG